MNWPGASQVSMLRSASWRNALSPIALLQLLLLPVLLQMSLQIPVASAESLTYFVVEKQARPLQIEHNGRQHSGIISDLVMDLFAESDIEVETVTLPFRRMLLEMKNPQHHNWISYGSPRWGKSNLGSEQNRCLLGEPVVRARQLLVTRADEPRRFDNIEDLLGERLIVLHGFRYARLSDYFASGQLTRLAVKDHLAAFKSLSARRGVAFVGMDLRVKYSLATEKLSASNYRLEDFSHAIEPHDIYLSYSCDMDATLLQELQLRYQQRLDQGRIQEIVQRYSWVTESGPHDLVLRQGQRRALK